MQPLRYKAVVMGMSAGGMQALKTFIPALPAAFPLPIAIVQHNSESSDGFLADYLNRIGKLTIKEAEDKEPLRSGHAYLASPGYHLLVEDDLTFSLSADPRVNYCCPSIDVLFESAADVFGDALIGVVLTGANSDGSQGLKTIRERGGLAIVQNPATAESRAMPQAALTAVDASITVDLENLAALLIQMSELRNGDEHDKAIRA
jgi:two-component system, chemotaxis family, protein-glutamate methylesterase/glutaminase